MRVSRGCLLGVFRVVYICTENVAVLEAGQILRSGSETVLKEEGNLVGLELLGHWLSGGLKNYPLGNHAMWFLVILARSLLLGRQDLRLYPKREFCIQPHQSGPDDRLGALVAVGGGRFVVFLGRCKWKSYSCHIRRLISLQEGVDVRLVLSHRTIGERKMLRPTL